MHAALLDHVTLMLKPKGVGRFELKNKKGLKHIFALICHHFIVLSRILTFSSLLYISKSQALQSLPG